MKNINFFKIAVLLSFSLMISSPALASSFKCNWKITVTDGDPTVADPVYTRKKTICFGVYEKATNAFDRRFDIKSFYEDAPSADYLLPSFIVNKERLSQQVDDSDNPVHVWNLNIETRFSVDKNIYIQWDGLPKEIPFSLTDQIGNVTDMHAVAIIPFAATKPVSTTVQNYSFTISATLPNVAPNKVDSNGNGIPDTWETEHGINLTDGADINLDSDLDGISNVDEYKNGTNPVETDTDGDGLSNKWEVDNGLDPTKEDTDGDGILDKWDPDPKTAHNFIAGRDTDGDGVSDLDEYLNGDDPYDMIPVAEAGLEQVTYDPSFITLDGSKSKDPDNTRTLLYSWTQSQTNPEQVAFDVLNGTDYGAAQKFLLITAGDYTFTLTVSYGKDQEISQDSITIKINNLAPVADAGQDRTVDVGATVVLDGKWSTDSNNDSLTFNWTQTGGTPVTLSTGTVSKTFSPQTSGLYTFKLRVTDINGLIDEDIVYVTVNGASMNMVPSAEAGDDITASVDTLITLGKSQHRIKSIDADNGPEYLTYIWEQKGGPAAVTITNGNSQNPDFKTKTTGLYEFSLKVSDGRDMSKPDTVYVAVNETFENKPVKYSCLYDDIRLSVGEKVDISRQVRCENRNFRQEALDYTWKYLSGSRISVLDIKNNIPFSPVILGVTTLSLIVSDSHGTSLPFKIDVIVSGNTQIPKADAGVDIMSFEEVRKTAGNKVVLGGLITDTTLNYQWVQTGGSNVTLYDFNTKNPYFMPTVIGKYLFQLTVDDGQSRSVPDELIVLVGGQDLSPVAFVKTDSHVIKVQKDGCSGIFEKEDDCAKIYSYDPEDYRKSSATYDPEGMNLSYEWRDKSGNQTEVISKGSNTYVANFTTDVTGSHKVELIVEDNNSSSLPASVDILVIKDGDFGLEVDTTKDEEFDIPEINLKLVIPEGTLQTDNDPIVGMGVGSEPATFDAVTSYEVKETIISDTIGFYYNGKPLNNSITVTMGLNDEPVVDNNKASSIIINSVNAMADTQGQEKDKRLVVYCSDKNTGDWLYETEVTRNTDDNTVSFKTENLTKCVVVSEAANNKSDSPGDGGGSGGTGSGNGSGDDTGNNQPPTSSSPPSESPASESGGGGGGGCFLSLIDF